MSDAASHCPHCAGSGRCPTCDDVYPANENCPGCGKYAGNQGAREWIDEAWYDDAHDSDCLPCAIAQVRDLVKQHRGDPVFMEVVRDSRRHASVQARGPRDETKS